MRKAAALLAFLGSVATVQPALAAADGKLQIKVLGTAVLPDGKIEKVRKDLVGLPAGTQTKANDNVVPTVAIEYFFTPNVSVETICCVTQHDVDATSGLPAGAELVADAQIIPATFTLKYHLMPEGAIRPYVGAGPTYFLFIKDKPGAAARTLGANGFKLDDAFGVALQAGVDVPVNDSGMVVSLDAKKYFVSTDAHWYVNGAEVINTKHKLDPWVLSAGVGFRF
jgi:outer membrane protein